MNHLSSCARRSLLLLVGLLAAGVGCSRSNGNVTPGSGALVVSPPQTTLSPTGQQSFTATRAGVPVASPVWSVKNGPAGGTITQGGLYTAPAVEGTYVVVALDQASGSQGEATVTVAITVGTTHGMNIPAGHPRLWFNAERLSRARAWFQANPFVAPLNEDAGAGYVDVALRGLLAPDASSCDSAITWALAKGPTLAYRGGVACNACRWFGEQIVVVYDWCYGRMSPQQRASFIATTNAWIAGWRDQTTWGHPPMFQNNYFWGYMRNELEWSIASYEDNQAFAETTLDFVFTNRLANSFNPSTLPGGDSRGGVAYEGVDYGQTMAGYPVISWQTASMLGRDLFSETDFFKEEVYALIHTTTPAATQISGVTGTGFTFFPFSDAEDWSNQYQVNHYTCDWMMTAAMRWPNQNIGRHARQWLQTTGSSQSCLKHVQAVDIPNEPLAFTGLPLDFFASGPGYLFGRNRWGPDATHFLFQGADADDATFGHQHGDYGTFQIWRNGRYLSRETVTYDQLIAGYGGVGTIDGGNPIGHNTVLVDGLNPGPRWSRGLATVERLESRPGYTFVATDLVPPVTRLSTWRREVVFLRALETFVVLDRLESVDPASVKTFINHCETVPVISGTRSATCTNGTQALVMTTLLPASSSYRVVDEAGVTGQHRIEVDTAPGTAQSYIVTVLQAKDASAAGLSPVASEDPSSIAVTLDAVTKVTFLKGMTSTGGTIEINGTSTALRGDVQTMSVTEVGPAWAP